ncbi:MAG: histidinol-phosphate aminotransferase family protein [Bdellovibrionales bacterium]|nr:histidinol-phosphate aminotransferase family protein [Bdellovibrionales bacterium]
MSFNIDLSLFDRKAHNPSFGSLRKTLKPEMAAKLIDFCVPVNPYFPTRGMLQSYKEDLAEILKYYPDQNEPIAETLARVMGLDPQSVVMANGSTEAITWIDHLFVKESIATPIPTFGRWTDQPLETGKRLEVFQRLPENNFALNTAEFVSFVRKTRARTAAICNPNNPTGALLDREEVLHLCRELADLDLIIVDESFIDFSELEGIPSIAAEAQSLTNVIVVKSLGKNFGMHGLRFGYTVSNAELAVALRRKLPHWNVNAIGERVIQDLEANFGAYEASRRQVIADRQYLLEELQKVDGLRVFPSKANFVFFRCPDIIPGAQLRDHLIESEGLFVRECGNKIGSSSQYIRIAANPRAHTDRLVGALQRAMRSLTVTGALQATAGNAYLY